MSTDEELIAMIRRGSDDAFTEAYRRYEPGLLRYVRGNCVGRRVAEEIIQETFVVLFQKRHALDGSKGSLGAYLFSIASRKLLRAGRNDWRSEALASVHLERPSHDPAMMKEEPIDPSSRVRILAGMLVRNGKEVLRDGGGIEVDASGVFGFTSADGTIVMALHPFCDAVRDGYIDGHRLYAAIDDTYYTWTSREPILQADGLHSLWVLRFTSAQMDEWGPTPGFFHAGGQVIIFARDEPPECSGR